MTPGDPEVDGTPPLLSRQICQTFLLEQYWHDNALVDPANVAYLQFEDTWHRLTFDHGIVIWRLQAERPQPHSMPELNAQAQIDNVGERFGLVGRQLLSFVASSTSGGSQVAFLFEGGITLILRNVADRTACLVQASHAA
jgi:hypothetical protein